MNLHALRLIILQLREGDRFERQAAAEMLGIVEIDHPEVIESLTEALNDEGDPVLRLLAAKALGEIGNAQTAEALAGRLNDEDWRVREAAAKALEKIGGTV